MDFVSIEFIKELLSETAKADLTEKLLIFGVAWWIVSRKVTEHFKKIESSLTAVATSVSKLNESMIRVESSHSERLKTLEEIVKKIITKVDNLESKGEK